jgi:hypothetical protein
MTETRRRELEALELRLLQERTEVLHELQRHLDGTGGWNREETRRLSRRQDKIQEELAAVRREIAELVRGPGC